MADSNSTRVEQRTVDEKDEVRNTVEVQYLGGAAAESDEHGSSWVDLRRSPVSKVATSGWKACVFIIGGEISERLTYFGIASNLITYLTTVLHESTPTAATSVNNWSGVTTVTPLLGAFIADAYLGRYWTIMLVSGVYFLGSFFLTLSVSVSGLKPPRCIRAGSPCPKPNARQVGFFYFSLYLISFGTGGLKPNLEALGADQFDEHKPAEKIAKNSFFNWWYFGIAIGATTSLTVLVYIQDNVGWGWGFGIPTLAIAIAISVFYIGTPVYRHMPPTGSPLTAVAQVLVAFARKWSVTVPADKDELYEFNKENAAQVRGRRRLLHTDEFLFLDKAAVNVSLHENDDSDTYNPWRLCTVTQVEEVKLVLRVMPIWITSLVFGMITAQVGTLFTKQGATLDNRIGPHFKVPPASMQIVIEIIILLLLPLYDCCMVPFLRNISRNVRGISLLQRLGVGLSFSLMSMITAALTENKRRNLAIQHGLLDKPSRKVPMSIFQLAPQYALFGISDVFYVVGLQEFFYDQMPDTMRSMGIALCLSTFGVGNFLSSVCITAVNKVTAHDNHPGWISDNLAESHLDFFYWLLAILSFINLGLFFLCSYWYKYKQEYLAPESSSLELDRRITTDTASDLERHPNS